jgi:hypothetical protein
MTSDGRALQIAETGSPAGIEIPSAVVNWGGGSLMPRGLVGWRQMDLSKIVPGPRRSHPWFARKPLGDEP